MRRLLLALAVAGCIIAAPAFSYSQTATILPFSSASGWLSSAPLDLPTLRGKVVLVDFWEYTCINCLRTLPYLQAWNRRYSKDGLVIIGVHTPEFSFSADPKNVEAATKHLGITWPIALDARYSIWKEYQNSIWPHEFLFNGDGQLVEQTEGEGRYQETEQTIQRLLRQRNPGAHYPPVMALLPRDNYTKPGAVCYFGTPEMLVSTARGPNIENYPPDQGIFRDSPEHHIDGHIYLNGRWDSAPQSVVSRGADFDSYLALRYHAIQVVAVLRPIIGTTDVRVVQDGLPIRRSDAAEDVHYDSRGNSVVTVNAARAYEMIANTKFGTHELRFYPEGSGIGFYSVDFESCEKGADGR